MAVAEQLYDALIVWYSQGSLEVTSLSLPFFEQFDSNITAGTYKRSSPSYIKLTSAVQNFADGFLSVAANYTPSNGSLSEQYDKSDGTPLSAGDLTWSYAAALTVFQARSGFVPASWGASGLQVPSVCSPNGVVVDFNVNATTVFGREYALMLLSVPSDSVSVDCRERLLDWQC